MVMQNKRRTLPDCVSRSRSLWYLIRVRTLRGDNPTRVVSVRKQRRNRSRRGAFRSSYAVRACLRGWHPASVCDKRNATDGMFSCKVSASSVRGWTNYEVVVVVVVVVAIEAGVRKSLRQTGEGRLKRLTAGFAFATATSLRDGCLLVGVNHRCLRTYMMGLWVYELIVTHAPTSYGMDKT